MLKLAHYDINIEFLQEKENLIADALSRVCPLQSNNSIIRDSNIDFIPVHHITQGAPVSKARLQELRLATQSKYLLLVDYYSRFPILHKLGSTTSKVLVQEMEAVFAKLGVPNVIVLDG